MENGIYFNGSCVDVTCVQTRAHTLNARAQACGGQLPETVVHRERRTGADWEKFLLPHNKTFLQGPISSAPRQLRLW